MEKYHQYAYLFLGMGWLAFSTSELVETSSLRYNFIKMLKKHYLIIHTLIVSSVSQIAYVILCRQFA